VHEPEHQRKPELAFEQGFVQTISITEGGSTVGSIKLPATFGPLSSGASKEDQAFAFGGFAPATISVNVHAVPAPIDAKRAMDNLVGSKPAGMKPRPERAKLVDTPRERRPCYRWICRWTRGPSRWSGGARCSWCRTGTHMVSITASVQAHQGPDEEARLAALSKSFEPLFDRVRASLSVSGK